MNTPNTICFSHVDHPSVLTELTIKPGVISSLLSVANRNVISREAELLFRLMAGQRVKMRLFSAQNIMFYVTNAQLDDAVERAKSTWERCYMGMLSAERLANIYEKFGDERMAMSIQSFHIVESMEEIHGIVSCLSKVQCGNGVL